MCDTFNTSSVATRLARKNVNVANCAEEEREESQESLRKCECDLRLLQ